MQLLLKASDTQFRMPFAYNLINETMAAEKSLGDKLGRRYFWLESCEGRRPY